jgi:transposase InsO family protein
LNPIFPPDDTEPFKVISVDLIVKLPKSGENDAILTITDQGNTKGVILIPCSEEMGTEELAKLYKEKAFPYIGLPSKLISDQDTRFTSKLFRELCEQLGVKQNISSAYHPQTDGESEHTNQTVETALRIFGNFRNDNWSEWLPLVQYQINSHVSNTTHFAPFELWMGYIPRAHQPDRPSSLPEIQERKEQLKEI